VNHKLVINNILYPLKINIYQYFISLILIDYKHSLIAKYFSNNFMVALKLNLFIYQFYQVFIYLELI